jgi:hypothetical protein
VLLSVNSKRQRGSAYVSGHFGTILGPDTPCTNFGRPSFMDDGQGQALDSPFVDDVLHGLNEVGFEDRGRASAKSRSSLLIGGSISHAVKRKTREEEPEEFHGTDCWRWCGLKARSPPLNLFASQPVRRCKTP